MVREVKDKVILHWNCRGLTELPEVIKDYGQHIQEIYLKWNKLLTLPPWITELFNVTNLYMYGNCINELPPELGSMTQLMELDLSANLLKEVPPCIGNLNNLKSLALNNNQIQKLPDELNQLSNLEILSISKNQFATLPEWIGSLPKLKELNVDGNELVELPNRLTLSHTLSVLSVCSNRLKYLPLSGFVSSPVIRFDANEHLNYLSYPLLLQLSSNIDSLINRDLRNTLGYGCFKTHSQCNTYNANIRLNIKMNVPDERDVGVTIELPRQLLRVYNIKENTTISLWELALRKLYNQIYKHTLSISAAPLNVKVHHEPTAKEGEHNLHTYFVNYTLYNLLMNGPIGICLNSHCQQPIFTEAWVFAGISYINCITTIALCCSQSCACKFIKQSSIAMNLQWRCIN